MRFEIGRTYRVLNLNDFLCSFSLEEFMENKTNDGATIYLNEDSDPVTSELRFVCEKIDEEGHCIAINDGLSIISTLAELQGGIVEEVVEEGIPEAEIYDWVLVGDDLVETHRGNMESINLSGVDKVINLDENKIYTVTHQLTLAN